MADTGWYLRKLLQSPKLTAKRRRYLLAKLKKIEAQASREVQ